MIIMHNISEFKINKHKYGLTLVEEDMAAKFYRIIQKDREQLGKWCSWANKIRFIDDEKAFIKAARQDCIFILAIIDEQNPIGIIDLHNLDEDKHTCEIGYWLSSEYQGKGIMYNSLQVMNCYAFNFFDIEKLKIISQIKNMKCRHVAKRAGFNFKEIKDPFAIYTKEKTDWE